MKIYYPLYYKDFSCIADRCTHSCCVGWEISVDEATMKKYRSLSEVEREDVLSHIGDDGCMILADGERCPFLCSDGLCRLISTYGDDLISHICRQHPGFYHRVGDRVECGIGASCEEACRIILSSDFGEFYLDEREGVEIADETNFDGISHRDRIYQILLDGDLGYSGKLGKIKAMYSIDDSIFTSESLGTALDELEYLEVGHRSVISLGDYILREEQTDYYERFFAYLVFRHLSIAENYDDLRARLGFCLLLVRMLERAGSFSDSFDELCLAARIISEEIEYSEENTAALIFEMECLI